MVDPGQPPVVETGVTIYSILPTLVLLGLLRVWLIVDPDPGKPPVIPPVILPTTHVNVLGVLAVSGIFVVPSLQIVSVAAVVRTGLGFTVTVIVYGVCDTQAPVVDVGVTRYSTVPAVAELGLVSTWLIWLPAPPVAPVIPPVIVPTVQVKLLGVLEVRSIWGLVALQIVADPEFVITGLGLTVTVIV